MTFLRDKALGHISPVLFANGVILRFILILRLSYPLVLALFVPLLLLLYDPRHVGRTRVQIPHFPFFLTSASLESVLFRNIQCCLF